MHDLFIEPVKYYDQVGRKEHYENTTAYFDNLLHQSGVNVEENRATVKAYKEQNELISQISSKISKYKFFRVLLIIAIIVGAILCFSAFSSFSEEEVGSGILMLLLGAGFLAGGIYLLVTKVNPLIKDSNKILDEYQQKANEILAKAEAQMAPLNALFTERDTFNIIEKTIPEFSFDNTYTKQHEVFLNEKHDFLDLSTDETTMTNTLAGRFAGNPFLYCQRLVHEMSTATYHGSMTITWTETYRDSSGNLCTRTRSETLHASVTKPKPEFYKSTYLGYGCQVAPNLSFSREPKHSEGLSEKALIKRVKSGEKELAKRTRKAVKTGDTFQEMANTQFDVLFGALDRDNETQFRVMYTPLAQSNTVDLVTNKVGYGDDFYFNKCNRFNYIISEHAQKWNMLTYPNVYYSYDVDTARVNFLNFNTNYFKSVFFDFAPLFSVPSYIEEPCASLEPYPEYDTNYPYYEYEVMANSLGQERFVHPESRTDAILKTRFLGKQGKADIVSVTAMSYTTVPRVDFVPVRGGDGNYHNVPVEWIEYIPVSNIKNIRVDAVGESKDDYIQEASQQGLDLSGSAYFHGLIANIIE